MEKSKKLTKGKILGRMIEAGIRGRERFACIARRLEPYDFETDSQTDEQSWDGESSFKVKVMKLQQFKREYGSRLYSANPQFKVSASRINGSVGEQRANLMQKYLSWSIGESGFYAESRSTVNDALGSGAGVMWFGLDPDKDNLIVAQQDSWESLILDPDTTKSRNINWCARERVQPIWSIQKRLDLDDDDLAKIPKRRKKSDSNADSESDDASLTDLGVYYEVYAKVGLHNYAGYKPDDDEKLGIDEPRVYYVTKSGHLLGEDDWPIPFHLDGSWPFEMLSFYDHPKSCWPLSPLGNSIGWVRALNWISTLMVLKAKHSTRTIIAVLRQAGVKIGEEMIESIVNGEDIPIDMIPIELPVTDQDANINKYIQQFNISSNLNELIAAYQHIKSEFEMETGLHEFLFVGNPSLQDRSAAASNIRDRNSKTRLGDMSSRLGEFMSRVGRKIALAARYLLDSDDIARVFGEESGQAWGSLMTTEQQSPDYWREKIIGEDPNMDPDMVIEMSQMMAGNGVTLEDWINEVDYTIEEGSLIRSSPEQEVEANDVAMNQLVPALISMGTPESSAVAFEFIANYADKNLRMAPSRVDAIRALGQQLMEQVQAQRQQQMAMDQQTQAAQAQQMQAQAVQMQQPEMM